MKGHKIPYNQTMTELWDSICCLIVWLSDQLAMIHESRYDEQKRVMMISWLCQMVYMQ